MIDFTSYGFVYLKPKNKMLHKNVTLICNVHPSPSPMPGPFNFLRNSRDLCFPCAQYIMGLVCTFFSIIIIDLRDNYSMREKMYAQIISY